MAHHSPACSWLSISVSRSQAGDAVATGVVHAGLTPDAGVVQASDTSTFIARARTRQWAREASVRTLA